MPQEQPHTGEVQQPNLADLVAHLSERVTSLESELTHTEKTYGTALTRVIKRMKKLEQKVKTIKARRRTNLVDSESDQDAEEQGRNLLQDLDLEAFEAQVPLHLDS